MVQKPRMMCDRNMELWNKQTISSFDGENFLRNTPCPWWNFKALLNDVTFDTLAAEYPTLDQFERHADIARVYDQRSHNRYYLALETSVYGSKETGLIKFEQLSPTWQFFIKGLNSDPYLEFVSDLLGQSDMSIRFAWHVAQNGQDVSPHIDSERKIGTHIFYFNTNADWSVEWGGGTVFYANKQSLNYNPEVEDFDTKHVASILSNYSTLFRNSDNAWHGVEPISCPDGHYRRIFNVIFEYNKLLPASSKSISLVKRFARKLKLGF